jgi:hypothetical protein
LPFYSPPKKIPLPAIIRSTTRRKKEEEQQQHTSRSRGKEVFRDSLSHIAVVAVQVAGGDGESRESSSHPPLHNFTLITAFCLVSRSSLLLAAREEQVPDSNY